MSRRKKMKYRAYMRKKAMYSEGRSIGKGIARRLSVVIAGY